MTCAQGANAEHSLSTFSMIMLLEYLPQEPSDPVYGKLMSGRAAYEWEAQSQYRASPLLPTLSHTALLAECCLLLLDNCCLLQVRYNCYLRQLQHKPQSGFPTTPLPRGLPQLWCTYQ